MTAWTTMLDKRLAEIERLRGEVLPAQRAAAIAAAVAAAGRGGRDEVATHMKVSVGAVDQALRRARDVGDEVERGLPADTLTRLLALEVPVEMDLPPAWREMLRWIVRGTVIDAVWIEQPGELLAQEVEDSEMDSADADALAAICRSWTRIEALAVIDRCQRGTSAVGSGSGQHQS